MSHTDYDAWLIEHLGGRHTFRVAGQDFTCKIRMSWRKYGALFFELAEATTGPAILDAQEAFILACVVKTDRERAAALLVRDDDDDEEGIVASPQLRRIVDDLMDYYAGKLGGSDNGSTSAQSDAGPASNVTSLSARS